MVWPREAVEGTMKLEQDLRRVYAVLIVVLGLIAVAVWILLRLMSTS